MDTSKMINKVIDREKGGWDKDIYDLTVVENAAWSFASAADASGVTRWEMLQRRHRDFKTKGISCRYGGYRILAFAMAGRLMLTIYQGDSDTNSITLKGLEDPEDSKSAGIQSWHWDDVEGVVKMFHDLCNYTAWKEIMKRMESDEKIFIG